MRLTKAQRLFLESLVGESKTATIEGHPEEWRTAKSLEAKGLIEIISERYGPGFFEFRQSQSETEEGR